MEQVRRVPDQARVVKEARVVAATVAVVVVSGPEAVVAVEKEVIDGETPAAGGSETDKAQDRSFAARSDNMPGGDHTGPLGQGPRTGRAAGYCAGYDMPGYMNAIPGGGHRGWSRNRGGNWGGGGRGWRHRYYATGLTHWQRGGRGPGWWPIPHPAADDVPRPTREQELGVLQADLRCLEQSTERIRRRIEELNAQTATTTED